MLLYISHDAGNIKIVEHEGRDIISSQLWF